MHRQTGRNALTARCLLHQLEDTTLKSARCWLEKIRTLWLPVCDVKNRLQPVAGVHTGSHPGQIHARSFTGGINRSAGVLCAWLVVACEHSAQEAVQLLLQKRPALRSWGNRPYVLEANRRLVSLFRLSSLGRC